MHTAVVRSPTQHAPRESPPLEVWAIGAWNHGEFRQVLPVAVHGEQWLLLEGLDAAEAAVAAGRLHPPTVMLLATPRPSGDTASRLENLLAASPLTRAVVVAGSWCEGELRTGRPPAGVQRVYWHQFPAWWRRCRGRIDQGLPPLWSYPPGMPVDKPANHPTQTKSVLVSTPDRAVFLTLRDTVQPGGFHCEWLQPHLVQVSAQTTPHAAGIVDGGQLDRFDARRLAEVRRTVDPTGPVTLLVDFPRAEHLPQARAGGATTVLGKPYLIGDLLESLQITTPPPAG